VSLNNTDVATLFVRKRGAGSGRSSTGNFWWEDGKIYSYNMLIGQYCGSTLFLTTRDDSPSVTTTQHIGKLYTASFNTTRGIVSFDLLDQVGVRLGDVVAWTWHTSGGDCISLGFKAFWLHVAEYLPPDPRLTTIGHTCVWRTHRSCTPFELRDALIPDAVNSAAWDTTVWMIGDYYIVGLNDTDYTRAHKGTPTWKIGVKQRPMTALDRAKEDRYAYCGMLRIEGYSFSPSNDGHEWFRVVPANVLSYPANFSHPVPLDE